MNQVSTTISSDRELIAHLGMTLEDAMRRLGRPKVFRDKVESGTPASVLLPLEYVELRLAAHRNDAAGCDDAVILDYIERNHPPSETKGVRETFARMAEAPDWSAYPTIWIVIPDVTGSKLAGCLGVLSELYNLPCELTVFLTSSMAKGQLLVSSEGERLLERKPKVAFRSGSYISAQAPRILVNPRTEEAESFLPGKARWVWEPAVIMKAYSNRLFEKTA